MSLQALTQQQRIDLANALTKATVNVRQNVNRLPVNYLTDVDASLAAAKTLLDAAIAAT